MVAPSAESVEKVQAWLGKNNITAETISPSGDMLSIKVPVSQANTLLSADFNEYAHDTTNQTRLRTLAYSLPETVKDHVAFIYPTTQQVFLVCCSTDSDRLRRFIEPVKRNGPIFEVVDLPRVGKRRRSRRAAVDSSCNTQITPACLQALYNIPTTAASASGNSLAVSGFIDEIPNKSDLSVSISARRMICP